ncbi:hypothetical protein AKJ43_00670 [candidate division MSBL1 archaeon SCGC-AAA261D19]|uniref:Flavin-dependent thymidylate synthase n=1 Tax=candidate division MSBL1 archaeon SCGC-AAA261D19 TaxID=1698273 RepID=A0A133V8J3_9EURY|nr:hypothetical protein AKJ43_00670 [candidate division MSBL1 archaeon SCGC-AAA261D19]
MKVELLSWTPRPEFVTKIASKTCYSEKSPLEMGEGENFPDISTLMDKGHTSVIEHATFTFAIEGISRACSHQLVRHRIASYSQQSQRMAKTEEYVKPPSIKKEKKKEKVFIETIKHSIEAYKKLKELGVPLEDARFVLPNATKTNIVVTMNARSLLNFFRLRCCLRAQWEIRELANRMLKLVRKKMPKVFEKAGAPCRVEGICPEDNHECKWYETFVVKP